MEKEISLDNLRKSKEVREIYRLTSNFNLHEEAIKLLQNAINKKRSDAIREDEKTVFVRRLN